MTASVNLIKALGGGWRAADLPYGGAATASPLLEPGGRGDASSRAHEGTASENPPPRP